MKYILFLLFPFSVLFGQDRYGNAQNNVFDNNMDFFAMAKVKNKSNSNFLAGVKGTIYLNKTWNKCQIYSSKENSNFSLPCNYNVYSDQFEIQVDTDMYILNQESVNLIRIGKQMFKPTNNSSNKSYYELLADGNSVKIVKLYDAKIMEVQTNTLGLFEQKLVINDIDYFLMNDGKLIKIPSSKSKIFDVLDLTDEQRKIYKKYNLRKTENLIDMVESL